MNIILYGERKDKYKITRLRLKAEAQVWMEAPRIESLIPIQQDRWKWKLLKRAANSNIAFLLEHNSTTQKSYSEGGLEYISDTDSNRGANSSKYQLPLKDITSQTHDIPGWTDG